MDTYKVCIEDRYDDGYVYKQQQEKQFGIGESYL